MDFITRHKAGILLQGEHKEICAQGLFYTINNLALQHGSSLQGRLEAARYILHITQNPPMYINEKVILITTHALRHPKCVVINVQNIYQWHTEADVIEITFISGNSCEVPMSKSLFKKRLAQASALAVHIHHFSQKESVYTMV
ncbi:competence protein ComK [Candidatus Xianfuyuplasma coldseepsis]|uniref:Uncharacterized protein n=1 Tax=Candidatus Xianfuyuplasma coldseepsis TaxID=2782163 RepID=A0A7L7KRJ2_9MOLU|nr:competence protein ComK [Xianfuyuplasma coldseepsis]QMS84418.1 hypothetical protein G4Z02_01225 [Xianfuyuplasma coldseepsis]